MKRDIPEDQEIVCGLLESLNIDFAYGANERDLRLAILLWAKKNGKLFTNQCLASRYDGTWMFEQRNPGFPSVEVRGVFIRINDFQIWKLHKGHFGHCYFNGRETRSPYQMLLKIVESTTETQGSILYHGVAHRWKQRSPMIPAMLALEEASYASPSAVLVQFGLRTKDCSLELLGIARLIFAIKLLANQKEKQTKKR